MKIFGIVLLVFAALNIIVAILAASNGAADAAGQKILEACSFISVSKRTKER